MGSDKDSKDKILISDPKALAAEFDQLLTVLSRPESPDTWEQHDAALLRLAAIARGGACKPPFAAQFVSLFKDQQLVDKVRIALESERTHLSCTAMDALSATARLGGLWEGLVPAYVPSVLTLLGRANKVYVSRASATLRSLIRNTGCSIIVPLITASFDSPSTSVRLGCAEALLCCLGGTPEKEVGAVEEGEKAAKEGISVGKAGLEKKNGQALGEAGIEGVIRKGGRDRDPKIRSVCRRVWEIYRRQWPERAAAFVGPLTPTIRRVLAIGKDDPLLSKPAVKSVSSSRPVATSRPAPTEARSKPVHPLSRSTSATVPSAKPARPAPASVPLPPSFVARKTAAPSLGDADAEAKPPLHPTRNPLSVSTGPSRAASRTAAKVATLSIPPPALPPPSKEPAALRKPPSSSSLRTVSAPVVATVATSRPPVAALSRPLGAPAKDAARPQPPSRTASRTAGRTEVPAHTEAARPAGRAAATQAPLGITAGRNAGGWKPARQASTSVMGHGRQPSASEEKPAKAMPAVSAVAPASVIVNGTSAALPTVAEVLPQVASPIKRTLPTSDPPTASGPLPFPVPAATLSLPSAPAPTAVPPIDIRSMVIPPFRPPSATQPESVKVEAAEYASPPDAPIAHSAPVQPVAAAPAPPRPPSAASSTGTVVVNPTPQKSTAPARPLSRLGSSKPSTPPAVAAAAAVVVRPPGRNQPFKPTRATSATASSMAKIAPPVDPSSGAAKGPNLAATYAVPKRPAAMMASRSGNGRLEGPVKRAGRAAPVPEPAPELEAESEPEVGSEPAPAVEPEPETVATPAAQLAGVRTAEQVEEVPPQLAEEVQQQSEQASRSGPCEEEQINTTEEPLSGLNRVEESPTQLALVEAGTPGGKIAEEPAVPSPVQRPSLPPLPVEIARAATPDLVLVAEEVKLAAVIPLPPSPFKDDEDIPELQSPIEATPAKVSKEPVEELPSSTVKAVDVLDLVPEGKTTARDEAKSISGCPSDPSMQDLPTATPERLASALPPLSSAPKLLGLAGPSDEASLVDAAHDGQASFLNAVKPSGSVEDLLVDFDHEDTVWIPRAPSLHDDLADLDDSSAATIQTTSAPSTEAHQSVSPERPPVQRAASASPDKIIDDSLAQFDLAAAAGDHDDLDLEEEPSRGFFADTSRNIFADAFVPHTRAAAPTISSQYEKPIDPARHRLLRDDDETAPIVNVSCTDSTGNYDRSLLAAFYSGDDTVMSEHSVELRVESVAPRQGHQTDHALTPRAATSANEGANAELEKSDDVDLEHGDRSATPTGPRQNGAFRVEAAAQSENIGDAQEPPTTLRRSTRNRPQLAKQIEGGFGDSTKLRSSTRSRTVLAEIQ